VAGSNLPIFGDTIGPILEQYPLATVRPGDICWYNDCYASRGAASHSPDQVFACRVFCNDEIVAFAQSWAHFNDIGGMRARSLSPDCEEIFQEGIIVPPVRIARDGHFNDELLRVFVRNSRFRAMVQGDTRDSIAAPGRPMFSSGSPPSCQDDTSGARSWLVSYKPAPSRQGPMVRIHLPPADSPSLSRTHC
jgi:N-methylhydantoinase B